MNHSLVRSKSLGMADDAHMNRLRPALTPELQVRGIIFHNLPLIFFYLHVALIFWYHCSPPPPPPPPIQCCVGDLCGLRNRKINIVWGKESNVTRMLRNQKCRNILRVLLLIVLGNSFKYYLKLMCRDSVCWFCCCFSAFTSALVLGLLMFI